MASLDEILRKTKSKTEKLNLVVNTKPFDSYISEGDRPYTQTGHKPNTNLTQTGHKPNTNLTQTEHKPNTNLTQTEHKPNTNLTQTEHKPNTNLTQTEHKPNTNLTQTGHKPNTNLTQTGHKPNTNLTQTPSIDTLSGIQKRLLIFVFNECKKLQSTHTPPLNTNYIVEHLNIALGSIKTSFARLCEKKFIAIDSYKNGRGGWSIYEIPIDIYNDLLYMDAEHKLDIKHIKQPLKSSIKSKKPVSSSSSILLNTTTTNKDSSWDFDITSFKNFGFTQTHLLQLEKSSSIQPDVVEQSLHEFKYDLDNNSLPNIKTGNINFLMGLFRKGVAYTSESYRDEEEAIILQMANKVKEKRQMLIESKFTIWEGSLTQDMRKNIMQEIPLHLRVSFETRGISDPTVKGWMMDYFQNKIADKV